jgi:hypothetical protein
VFNYNTISMSSLSGRMDFTEDEWTITIKDLNKILHWWGQHSGLSRFVCCKCEYKGDWCRDWDSVLASLKYSPLQGLDSPVKVTATCVEDSVSSLWSWLSIILSHCEPAEMVHGSMNTWANVKKSERSLTWFCTNFDVIGDEGLCSTESR